MPLDRNIVKVDTKPKTTNGVQIGTRGTTSPNTINGRQSGTRGNTNYASSYQMNLSKPVETKATEPVNTRVLLGHIYEIAEYDEQKARKLFSDFSYLQSSSSSRFYNPYAQATNRSIANLAAYGVDTSKIDDNFFAQNDYLRQYLKYDGTTNTPTKPGKKATAAEKAAYEYYQIWSSEAATKKAETQWAALQEELTYWAKRADRNLSDDEIINRIDWSKYGELTKMDENKLIKPNEYNRAIGYSKDALYGVLWNARNGNEGGDLYDAMANSALGRGNQWQENKEVRDRLTPGNEKFNPFSVGSTGIDDAAVYFNVPSFGENWLAENQDLAFSEDETEQKMYRKVYDAEQNTLKAENALEGIMAWIDNKAGADFDRAKKKLDDLLAGNDPTYAVNGKEYKLGILNDMDAYMGKDGEPSNGKIVPMTRAVDYKYSDILKKLEEKCAENDRNNTAAYLEKMAKEFKSAVGGTGITSGISSDQLGIQGDGQSSVLNTKQAGEVIKSQNEDLNDTADMLADTATPDQTAVRTNAWDVMWSTLKSAWDGITIEGIKAKSELMRNTAAASVVSLGSATLNGADVMQGYTNAENELSKWTKERDALAPQAAEIEKKMFSAEAAFDDNAYYSSGDDLTAQPAWNLLTEEQKADVQDTFTYEGFADGKAKFDRYLAENRQNAEPLTEEEQQIYNAYRDAANQASVAQQYIADNQAAYDKAVKDTQDALTKYEDAIQLLKDSGVDTQGMEDAYAVTKSLLEFTQYDPTQWDSYSVYHEYSQMMYAQGGGWEHEYNVAKSVDDEVLQNIEYGEWVLDYVAEHGMEIPDSIRNNVQRWVNALKRQHQDFENLKLIQNEGFKDNAEKGREATSGDRVFNGASFAETGSLEGQTMWRYLTSEQQQDLIDRVNAGGSVYDIANAYEDYASMIGIEGRPLSVFTDIKASDIMTDYEKDTYYYLLETQGADAAEEYYNHLANDSYGVLNKRAAEITQGRADELADAGFWGRRAADALSMLLSPVQALGSAYYMGKVGIQKLKGDTVEVNPYNVNLTANIYKKEARAEIQREIDRVYGDNPVVRDLLSGLQEIISNRGDSFVNMMAFGPLFRGIDSEILQEFVGALPMSVGAATDAVAAAKEKGASDTQLLGVFLSTLLAESATEAISIDNMKKAFKAGQSVTGAGLKAFLKNWLTRSGVSEMVGESINDIIENWADEEFLGNESDFRNSVNHYMMDEHMSQEDAILAARRDQMMGVLHTALISYLSPGVDIIQYGLGQASYVNNARVRTRALQKLGNDVSIFDIMRADKEAKAVADARETVQATENAIAANEEATNAVLPNQPNEKKLTQGEIRAEAMAPAAPAPAAEAETTETTEQEAPAEAAPAQQAPANQNYGKYARDRRYQRLHLNDEKTGGIAPDETTGPVEARPAEAPVQGQIEVENMPEVTPIEEANPTVSQESADYSALESVRNADPKTRTAVIASVLDVEKSDASGDRAKAAATYLGNIIEDEARGDTVDWMQDIILSAYDSGTDTALVKQAIQNAALGGEASAAYQMMHGEDFLTAPLDQQAAMLASTVEQDNANADLQDTINKRVQEFRVEQAKVTVLTDGKHMDTVKLNQVAQKAQQTLTTRQNELTAAEDAYDKKIDIGVAKSNAVEAATEAWLVANDKARQMANSPSMAEQSAREAKEAMNARNAAIGELTAAEAVVEEYRQRWEKAKKNVETAQKALTKAQSDFDTKLNQDALALVNDEDAQRQQKQAELQEQERQAEEQIRLQKEQEAEAQRQQTIADQRSGKTQEDSDRAKLERLAAERGYTGEQAAKFIDDVMNFARDGRFRNMDMSKQLSKAEGYLMMGALSRRFGVNVVIGPTENGVNGSYDAATNTITLSENLPAGQVLVEFALHELTHTLEKTGTYKQYHDTVLNMLYPSKAELQNAVATKMAQYEDAGHPIDETQAKREIVADFTRTRLNDKAMVERMVDAGLGGRMRNALHNVNQFLKNQKLKGEQKTQAENLRKAERLFQQAIRDRAQKAKTVVQQSIQQANTPEGQLARAAKPVVTNSQGDAIVSEVGNGTVSKTDDTELSVASWTDEERTRVKGELLKAGFTEEQADKWIADVNSVAATVLADRGRLDYEADPGKTMLKPNAEYVKTLDASTLCAKRLLYQGTFNAIQHLLPNTPLLPEDLIDLANMMRDMGYETPCGICYVESRRRQLGKFTEQWLEKYDGEYKPTIDEVTTSDGLERLRQEHPQAYEDFIKAMNKLGTMNPKVVQLRTDYRGEISQITPGQVQKVKDIGGLRIQSFSDFEVPHLIDMMQAVMDMSSKKLTAQAYTKVPAFPWVFGDTGVKINLSLIGKGTGLDENGNLVFDDVEGMPFEEAMRIRQRYSKNVGTILVGINDEHIIAAMGDDRIDFIIPFHKSGWSKEELAKMPVLNGYSDYTDSQNEKRIIGRNKDGSYKTESLDKTKRVNFQPVGENGYWDFSKSGRENAEAYLRMCAEDGRVPKFAQFLVDNGDGSYSLPQGDDARSTAIREGYWKTLIDFKMYDNDGNGAPQTEVTPNVNMEEAQRVLSDYSLTKEMPNGQTVTRENNNDLPVANEVVDAFVEQYKATHPDREYSISTGEMTPAQLDQAYQEAVDSGDMETAQADVDAAAERSGYTIKAYHGTPDARGVGYRFVPEKAVTGPMPFFTSDESLAEEYSHLKPLSHETYFEDQYTVNGLPIIDWWDGLSEEQKEDIAKKARSIMKRNGEIVVDAQDKNDPAEFDELVDDFDGNVMLALAHKWLDSGWVDGDKFVEILNMIGISDVKYTNPRSEKVYSVFLKIKNPFDVSTMYTKEFLEELEDWWMFNGAKFEQKPERSGWHKDNVNMYDWIAMGIEGDIPNGTTMNWTMIPDGVVEYLKSLGYDGIRDKSGKHGGDQHDVWIPFSSEQIKSSDPVTYDDDGNVIPLSQRFNSENPDIRYSAGTSELTDADRLQAMVDAGILTQEEAQAQYSTPEESEVPTDNMGERQWGRKGAQQSDEIAELAKAYVLSHNQYAKETNAEQLGRAIEWVRSLRDESRGDPDGFYRALEEVSSETFDYRSADGQARMLAVIGLAAARHDTEAQIQLADAYNKQGTDLGRALQARKMWGLMTPEGRIASLRKMITNLENELSMKSGKKQNITLSRWIYEAAAVAETEEDYDLVHDAAAAELGAQLPVNWGDRLRSWRMLSMLMNPRTHIRNVLGNLLFEPAVGIKNKLGALGEIISRQDERTKTLRLFLSKDVRDFARLDAKQMEKVLRGEAKYGENTKIRQQQKTFGTGNGIISKTAGKALQWLSDVNSKALEAEDWVFLKGHYTRALGGWMQANGYTATDLYANPELLDKGREYAINEAQKATYRDFNEMANKLNGLTRNNKTLWGKALGFGVDAVLPFKKTPANILRRGLEYSPLSIARSLSTDLFHLKQYQDYQNGKLDVLPEKAISPNQFIDRLCSGLTGTGIMTIGAILGNMGIVKVGLKDDDDEFDKLEGDQEYAVTISIGDQDVSFTMDWAAPMSMPFFVGAALPDLVAMDGEFDIKDMVNAIGNITEPLTNLSMLDGVNTLLKTSQSGDESSTTLAQIAAKILSNYVTSYIPSVSGAIARSYDPIRRKAFVKSGEGGGIMGTFNYAREQIENKLPGASQSNIPVRDAFGRIEESTLLERIAENFILPGYINEKKEDPIVEELRNLHKRTGIHAMIPTMPSKYFQADGKKYVLSDKEYDQLTEDRGQTAYKLIGDLMNNEYYKQAPAEDKAKMVQDAWTYATENAKYNVNNKANVDSWVLNSRTNPVQGIVNRNKELVESEYKTGYKKAALEAVEAGDQDALDVCIEKLKDVGVSESSVKTYIGNAYKQDYIRAYQNNDKPTMMEIETTLDSTGLGFDTPDKYGNTTYDKWIEEMYKQTQEDEDN